LQPVKIFLTSAVILSVVVVSGLYGQQSNQGSDDPVALLNKGIELFKNYKYAEATKTLRTARKADLRLKRLSTEQKKQLLHYLDESAIGYRLYLMAGEKLQEADGILKLPNPGIQKLKSAEKSYKMVIGARKYLPPAMVARAEKGLDKVTKSLRPAKKPVAKAKPAPKKVAAKPVVKKPIAKPPAKKAQPKPKAKKKKTAPAKRQAPPRAVRRVRPEPQRVSAVAVPRQPTLLDQILKNREIQKQQARAAYREAERNVRMAVLAKDFLAARDALRQARQQVRLNRRLFSQREFERLQLDVQSLEKFIEREQQRYQAQRVREQMKEAEQRKFLREQEVQEEKFKKIAELFAQAKKLRAEKKFEEAIEKCRQILAIEPKYERAQWVIEDLKDAKYYGKQHEVQQDINEQRREVFGQADEARIGWAQDLRYPKNWEQLTQQRQELMRRLGRPIVTESPATTIRRKLESKIVKDLTPLRDISIRKAFDWFRDQLQTEGINLFVSWSVLEDEGLSPDDPVDFSTLEGLKNITLRKALELFLGAIGFNANYAIDTDGIPQGLLRISTTDNLRELNLTPRMGRFVTRVYNISDIMAYQPSLSGIPQVEPQQEEESIQQEDIEAREFEELEDLEEIVDFLRELIVNLVRPDTWAIMGAEPGGTIDVWRSRYLIIYQAPEVHDEIVQLLDKLRETQNVQIAMEARFVTVSSNFLEKIGLDLDIVFNQGHAGYDFTGAENTFGNLYPTGAGQQLVQPRTFSQLGSLPISPTAGPGVAPLGYTQPYGHHGLVPTDGNTGFRSSKWTPIPFLQSSNTLVSTEDTSLPGNLARQAVRPAFQVVGAFLDDLQVNFLLEATQMDRYSSIAQAPRVVMQNGTLGYLAVQTDVPYIEEIEVTVGEQAAAQEPQVEFMGFGTVLAVRATTRDLQYVNMYVVPQLTVRAPDADLLVRVPIVAPGTVGYAEYVYPGRRSTRIESVVNVPDGGTLLLGGLKMCGEIETEAGVPVLDKMPILKRFFSNRAVTRDNFTLLILVKPKIYVREEAEQGYVTTGMRVGG